MSSWDRTVLIVEDDAFLACLLSEILDNRGFRVHVAGDAVTALPRSVGYLLKRKAFDPAASSGSRPQ